jgi:hypothetical protein
MQMTHDLYESGGLNHVRVVSTCRLVRGPLRCSINIPQRLNIERLESLGFGENRFLAVIHISYRHQCKD